MLFTDAPIALGAVAFLKPVANQFSLKTCSNFCLLKPIIFGSIHPAFLALAHAASAEDILTCGSVFENGVAGGLPSDLQSKQEGPIEPRRQNHKVR